MTTNCLYYPAPGTANLLAEIEDRLELLNDIVEEYGQSGKTEVVWFFCTGPIVNLEAGLRP
jgi:hypothetical protein